VLNSADSGQLFDGALAETLNDLVAFGAVLVCKRFQVVVCGTNYMRFED
jgi:hypothetical protein